MFFGPCAHDMRNGVKKLVGEGNFKTILQEFGSLEELAFVILESSLYSKIKYGSINVEFGDTEYSGEVANAQLLSKQLQDIKQKFFQ